MTGQSRVEIVTMADINSNEPLQLTVGADDGSPFPVLVGSPPHPLIH